MAVILTSIVNIKCIVNTACDNSKNAVYKETRVAASNNDKMKLFYINRLDDKYSSSILIKSCHEGKSVPACNAITHKIVKQNNKPNYLGARLKVDSQLNLDEWKKELVGYWDTQLIVLLYFGFPLDFNRGSPLEWEGSKHKSATEYPGDIDAYLLKNYSLKPLFALLINTLSWRKHKEQ